MEYTLKSVTHKLTVQRHIDVAPFIERLTVDVTATFYESMDEAIDALGADYCVDIINQHQIHNAKAAKRAQLIRDRRKNNATA